MIPPSNELCTHSAPEPNIEGAIGTTDLMIPVGRGGSGPSLKIPVNPIKGGMFPGPMSVGIELGNGIIPLAEILGAVWSHLHHFLEPLLSIHLVILKSNLDSHSYDTGETLHFPIDLTSFQRFLSFVLSSDCLVSTLQCDIFQRRVYPLEP